MNKFKEIISKNYKKILVIISVLLIMILGVLISFFLYDPKEKSETQNSTFQNLLTSFSSEYEYLALTETGEYYISDAPYNISFDITEGTTYNIVDENNKEVEVQLKDLTIINNKGYEPGETYTLTIDNGSFTSEKLKDTKEVNFKIARDESKHYKYNEEIKKTTNEIVEIIDNQLITNENYAINDIVAIYEGDKIVEAYVIKEKISSDTYKVENATIDQIFDELDFYYKEYADLSNYKTIEALEEYIIADAKSSHWYDFLITEVHALPKISIQFNKVENGIEANVEVEIKAGEKSIFLNSKYHNFTFSYTIMFQAETLFDITLTNWDAQIKFKMQQNFDLNIDNSSLDYNMKGDKGFLENLKKAIEEDKKRDISEKEIQIANIPIPIVIPVLSIDIEVSLVNELNMSMDLDVGVGLATEIVVGFDYGVGEKFKPLGSFDFKMSDLTALFSGNIEDKLGVKLGVQLSFVGVVEAGIVCTGGVYGSAKLAMSEDIIKSEFKADATIELGAFIELGLEAELGPVDFDYVILDNTFSFYTNGWEYTYNHKKNQSQTAFEEESVTNNDKENSVESEKDNSSSDSNTNSNKNDNSTEVITPIEKKFKVTFDSNGGSKVSSQTITAGQKASKPNNPTREWYEFIEWELDGKPYDFTKPVSKDIVLKASWKDKLACTFDGEMVDGAEYVNGQYKYIYNKENVDSIWKKTKVEGWSVVLAESFNRKPVTSNLCRTINEKPIVSMAGLFSYNHGTVDLSSFDTSNVYNMNGMFSGMSVNVNLCSLDTSNVIDMSGMFENSKATSIDISCLDTSKVTNMSDMFAWSTTENVILKNIDTSKVTNISGMFRGADVLTIDLSDFNTKNVTNFDSMFSRSSATTIIGLENFETTNAVDMSGMFSYAKIQNLNLSSFNTTKVTEMGGMFEHSDIKTIDLSSFKFPEELWSWVVGRMFSDSELTTIYASNNNVNIIKEILEKYPSKNTVEIIVK